MEQRSVSDAHVDKHSVSPIATGATAAMLAQQSGLMPIAVTLFTLLSAATFWRNVPPCSEAAKSLVDIKFEQSVFESMPPPPKLSQRPGNTSYWGEAKNWARHVWLAEVLGPDAVLEAMAKDAAAAAATRPIAPAGRKAPQPAFDKLFATARRRWSDHQVRRHIFMLPPQLVPFLSSDSSASVTRRHEPTRRLVGSSRLLKRRKWTRISTSSCQDCRISVAALQRRFCGTRKSATIPS